MAKKPWFHQGLKFRCVGCGDCCIGAPGYVWVNKAEIEAIADVLQIDVETFEMRYVRQVGIRKSLVEFPNGDCVFFDNDRRRCDVYDVRPRQCRTWPFWESNIRTLQAWEEMCECCAGAGRGPLVTPKEIASKSGVLKV